MSYIYDFADNKIITPAELDAVSAQLGSDVTVSPHFAENTAYAVSRLNLIRSDIVSRGVLWGMEPVCTDTTVTVGTGVCFFENGMRLEITEPEVFELLPDTKNYIYMYASPVCVAAVPVISKAAQTAVEFIPIAEIENGKLTDTRIFSQAKIPLKTGSRVTQSENIIWSVLANIGEFSVGDELTLSNSGFSKIFVKTDRACGIWDRASGLFTYICFNANDNNTVSGSAEMILEKFSGYEYKIKFEVSGNVLKTYVRANNSHPGIEAGIDYISEKFDIEII